jgi:hypothetical protein
MGALEPRDEIEGHEVGLVVEAIGRTAEEARAVLNVAWHTGLHHPVPEWQGLISNWAFPYSPPELDAGPVYRFCVNHLMELDDPLEAFRIDYVEVGRPALAGAHYHALSLHYRGAPVSPRGPSIPARTPVSPRGGGA